MARTAWLVCLWAFSCALVRADDRGFPTAATITKEVDKRQELIYQLMDLVERTKPFAKGIVVLETRKLAGGDMQFPKSLDSGSPEIEAMRSLGQLRADEAVWCLLDVIDLQYTRFFLGTSNLKDREPIHALSQMGKFASRSAVRRLAMDDCDNRARMYVRVIANVEGVHLGREMVKYAADLEEDEAHKARLEKAVDLFKDAHRPIP